MESPSRVLTTTPEGVLHLFLNAGASVEILACAFHVDVHVVESCLRDAMRKRDAIAQADAPFAIELVCQSQGAG